MNACPCISPTYCGPSWSELWCVHLKHARVIAHVTLSLCEDRKKHILISGINTRGVDIETSVMAELGWWQVGSLAMALSSANCVKWIWTWKPRGTHTLGHWWCAYWDECLVMKEGRADTCSLIHLWSRSVCVCSCATLHGYLCTCIRGDWILCAGALLVLTGRLFTCVARGENMWSNEWQLITLVEHDNCVKV